MSLARLKEKAAELLAKEQRELIVFLVALEAEQMKQLLAADMDENDPNHWMELDRVGSISE